MPWWFRPYRYRRRYWRRPWRRTRKTIRFRRRRRRWVSRFRKRKLKRITVKEYQPQCIRRAKVIGYACLFQTTSERITHNFDMYEYSPVPEFLPGGGGFGIKNWTFEALYSDHIYARNIWTQTNVDLPLIRYRGVKITLYQSALTDYVFTFNNQLPMQSSLGMYNSMQPSIHMMARHAIIIPSKKTHTRKKPYTKIFVPPPSQLLNKWYFQQDICTTPLVMTRATAISLDNYFLDPHGKSSNITIPHLNATLIKNRQFKKNPTSGYWANTNPQHGKVYLYSTKVNFKNTNEIKIIDLIFLGRTTTNTPGSSMKDNGYNITSKQQWITKHAQYWGNPFNVQYLTENDPVLQSTTTYSTYLNQMTSDSSTAENLTLVHLVDHLRYNPYADQGIHNNCYFKSCTKDEEGWEKPDNPDLINEHLPLWLLIWGFTDYHRKIKKHIHLDDEWLLVINTDATTPPRTPLVVLNQSWIDGMSPYEEGPNKADQEIWYPSLQYQEITINNIGLCGPGTPKIPKDTDVEAKIKYKFLFKFGGHPPPMSQIEDPKNQPSFPIPNNQLRTNSLQNPTTYPEQLLWSFDERRGQITKKAIQRIKKDYEPTTTFITDSTSRFSEPTQGQKESTSEESSSEEETETLFEKLQQQRSKQRRLKQRILRTIAKIQKSE
nr:MAG: ORF1 [TTV-like mini virus]